MLKKQANETAQACPSIDQSRKHNVLAMCTCTSLPSSNRNKKTYAVAYCQCTQRHTVNTGLMRHAMKWRGAYVLELDRPNLPQLVKRLMCSIALHKELHEVHLLAAELRHLDCRPADPNRYLACNSLKPQSLLSALNADAKQEMASLWHSKQSRI